MRIAVISLLLLAGCNVEADDSAVPSQADIARLEAKLAQHPCIGPVGDWERNYRFSRKSGLFTPHSLSPDIDVIEFHLRRAGTITIEPGRQVLMPNEDPDWPDSAAVRVVEGTFKIEGGILNVDTCEPLSAR